MTVNPPDTSAGSTPVSKAPPLVSVVLSFYNEAAILKLLIERLRNVLRAERSSGNIRDYELIFINDNSTDESLDILIREFKAGNDLVILNMSNNFGVSECVLAGMAHSKGDAVVYMDADLQDPPELLPELIARWREDPEVEVVYTTRLSRAGEHPLKLFVTKWGYRFINAVSKIELPVDSGDFKLLSRRVVNELVQLREKNPFVRGLVSWIGFKQKQVFYHREERADGREQTKRSAMSMKVINYWLDTALISFSDAPLKAMLFLGFVISLTSLAYIFVVLFQKLMGWYEPGWPALMAAILLLGGMQLLTLGVLGLYINTIFMNTRGRPNYIVKDVIAPDERNSRV